MLDVNNDKLINTCKKYKRSIKQDTIYYKWASVKMTLKFSQEKAQVGVSVDYESSCEPSSG